MNKTMNRHMGDVWEEEKNRKKRFFWLRIKLCLVVLVLMLISMVVNLQLYLSNQTQKENHTKIAFENMKVCLKVNDEGIYTNPNALPCLTTMAEHKENQSLLLNRQLVEQTMQKLVVDNQLNDIQAQELKGLKNHYYVAVELDIKKDHNMGFWNILGHSLLRKANKLFEEKVIIMDENIDAILDHPELFRRFYNRLSEMKKYDFSFALFLKTASKEELDLPPVAPPQPAMPVRILPIKKKNSRHH